MKKLFNLLLSFIISFNFISIARAQELLDLPKKGEVVYGFETLSLDSIDIIKSKTVLFEHQKTKAKLLYIQNNDKNRMFNISFKTPTLDDTGVNHVLEHVIKSGSKKYSFKDRLFRILNNTYNTGISGYTHHNFTTYTASSMSEKQLLKFTDVYMDCIINPSIYNEREVFDSVAWHYEKDSIDAPIKINGTVYNEIKDLTKNIQTSAYYNNLEALFPNSITSNISSGTVEDLISLTYEQVLEAHKKYYNPSNMLIILYGDLDYKQFLEVINKEYLAFYGNANTEIETGEIEPLTETVDKTFYHAAYSNSSTEDSSRIDYSYAMTGLSNEDKVGLMILAKILNNDISPLKKYMEQSNMQGDVSVSFDMTLPQPVLNFKLKNTNENSKEDFKQLIDSCMQDVVRNGFDSRLSEAVISSILFENSTLTETSNLGYDLALPIIKWWATYNEFDYFNMLNKNINNIKNKVNSQYFEALCHKYILSNKHSAIIATVPKPYLLEKKENEFKNMLIEKEKSMSKQQLQEIVEKADYLKQWSSSPLDQQKLDSLSAVNIAELPEEVKLYNVTTKTIDNVTYLSAQANTDSINYTNFIFDTSAIPFDKLHYLSLFTDLLGNTHTKNYTLDEMNILKTRYLNDLSISVDALKQEPYRPNIQISWLTLKDEYTKSMEIVKELLFNTEFNISEIKRMVYSTKLKIKSELEQSPEKILIAHNIGYLDKTVEYKDYLTSVDYYKFLDALERDLKISPDLVIAELENIRDTILNKNNLIVEFAGDNESINLFYGTVNKITNELSNNEIVKQNYSQIPTPSYNEAVMINSKDTAYNMLSNSYKNMNVEFNGKYIPLFSIIYDKYLAPNFSQGSTNLLEINRDYISISNYRDVSIKETFEIYNKMSDFIKDYNITQYDLNGYILKSFEDYILPLGELEGAIEALDNKKMGIKSEDKLNILKQIKSTTVSDFKDMADMADKLSKGIHTTVGSPDLIEANKDLYEKIITLEY